MFIILPDTGTIRANPYNPHDPAHQWIFSGEVIVNRMNPGQVSNNNNSYEDNATYDDSQFFPVFGHQEEEQEKRG